MRKLDVRVIMLFVTIFLINNTFEIFGYKGQFFRKFAVLKVDLVERRTLGKFT